MRVYYESLSVCLFEGGYVYVTRAGCVCVLQQGLFSKLVRNACCISMAFSKLADEVT